MPLILPGNVFSSLPTGYDVDNSCRFNRGDSPYMHITPGGDGDLRKFTVSFWCKRGTLTTGSGTGRQSIFTTATNDQISFDGSTDKFAFLEDGGDALVTNRLFRDCSAWYHIVVAVDTEQGVAANRIKLYVNGTLETSFSTSVQTSQNADMGFGKSSEMMSVGRSEYDDNRHFDGYLAEFYYINNSQLAASDFGEFDEDSPTIWKPKAFSGSFGTNGFYLDFEDSSNLGNDANGGTDLTEVNLAAADQATDTPTNNFCTLNPLHIATSSPPTFSEGNLGLTSDGSNWRDSCGTIGLTNGRWYFETKAPGNTVQIGVCSQSWLNAQGANVGAREGAQATPNEAVYGWYGNNGTVYYRTSAAQGTAFSGNTWSTEVISVYLDLEDNLIYFAKDNTMENSGTGYALATGEIYFPMVVGYVSGTTYINLGSTGAFGGTAVSSAVADDNGYGAFEFDPSRGGASDFNSSAKKFYALCTKNLAEFG